MGTEGIVREVLRNGEYRVFRWVMFARVCPVSRMPRKAGWLHRLVASALGDGMRICEIVRGRAPTSDNTVRECSGCDIACSPKVLPAGIAVVIMTGLGWNELKV